MRRLLLTGLAALALGACASGGAPNPADDITIRVVNDFSSPVTIYHTWRGTPNRIRLGNVQRGESETFLVYYRSGELRMVVQSQAGGRTLLTNPQLVNEPGGFVLTISQNFDIVLSPEGSGR